MRSLFIIRGGYEWSRKFPMQLKPTTQDESYRMYFEWETFQSVLACIGHHRVQYQNFSSLHAYVLIGDLFQHVEVTDTITSYQIVLCNRASKANLDELHVFDKDLWFELQVAAAHELSEQERYIQMVRESYPDGIS